jgi:hypothetical protein
MSNNPTNQPPPPPNFGSAIPLPGLADAARAIGDLTREIQGLKTALSALGGSSSSAGAQVGNIFKNLTGGANTASTALKTLFSQMQGGRPAGQSIGSLLEYGIAGDFSHDISMFPLRFMQSTISANRQLAYNASSALSGMQYATGASGGRMLDVLGQQMRSSGGRYGLRGTADEIAQTFATARQFGAMYDFGAPTGQPQPGVRTEGFFRGTAELANMYPGASLPGLAGALGSFAGNTAAQQRSLFMSGGAFGMIGQGGAQKTVSQWAESILNYLETQRFGAQRGQPFTYPELITQQFPGSNIDAWLDINGVPPDMKEAWWNYALNKAKTQNNTGGGVMAIEAQSSNLAFQRSKAVSATTKGQFQMATSLSGPYRQRENANADFNTAMASFINSTVRKSAITSTIANLPDTMEEFLMQFLENSGVLGSIVGAGIGYGTTGFNLISNLFGEGAIFGNLGTQFADIIGSLGTGTTLSSITALEEILAGGDVGDTGWGAMGGTTAMGLHPDMNKKVGAMMRANPRLRMNSGRRDEVTQRNLRGKGYSRVSGKSSAHTRGLAADLGPASEYGWIMANARKFGLQSGARHGEPWHVGMSGIGDAGSESNAGLGGLLSKLFSSDISFEDIGSIFPAFFTMLSPQHGGGTGPTDAEIEAKYGADTTGKLLAAGKYDLGGKWGGTELADIIRRVQSATAGASEGGGVGNVTLVQAMQQLGLSSTGLSDGAMVAILANRAGFTGNDLITAVAIAGRESHFRPDAFNDNLSTGDLSYGLFQINMLGNLGPARRAAYGLKNNEELFNPNTNLRVAYAMAHENSTPFYAWGPYRGDDPRDGTDVNAATAYVHEAGLGDIDSYGGGGSVRIGGSRMSFNNTFVINGGGGGNSGIDVRRAASQIADHLEREMRGRMERAN